MRKILDYLNKPAQTTEKPWHTIVISSCIVFFVLAVFQPFGLSNVKSHKWLIISGFASVTAVSTFVFGYIVPFIFKGYYSQKRWTIAKNLLNHILLILFIGIANFFFDWFLTKRDPNSFWSVFYAYLIVTALIGIIPSSAISIIAQNRALKRRLSEARDINENRSIETSIEKKSEPTTDQNENVLLSGLTKDSLEVNPKNIIYIESSGNYVIINYTKGEILKRKQLRATIGQIENDLLPYTNIIRCHRAFIINVSKISEVDGNSQGYTLSFDLTKDKIPVSRSYTKTVRSCIEQA